MDDVPVLRSTTLIDAEPRTVAGLLRDATVWSEALGRAGHRCSAAVRLLAPGDELLLDVVVVPGVRVPVGLVVRGISVGGMTAGTDRGRLHAESTTTLTGTGAGTLVLDELRWSSALGPLLDVPVLRRLVLRLFAARSEVLVDRARLLSSRPVVVATAIIRDGRVLAARRTHPPALAGRWELPGGRVEPDEPEPAAVTRECKEELGTQVQVTGRLGTDLPIDVGVLRVHTARLEPDAPEPQPVEHSELRWVGPAELAALDWVAADRAVLPDLVAALHGATEAVTEDAAGGSA